MRLRAINHFKMSMCGQVWTQGQFDQYVESLRGLKLEDHEDCDHCAGKGKVEDSTGLYPMRCGFCSGTGRVKTVS